MDEIDFKNCVIEKFLSDCDEFWFCAQKKDADFIGEFAMFFVVKDGVYP